jgi:spore maturation protein CgeB
MKLITNYTTYLRGVFLPKALKEDLFFKDIADSMKTLEYYGIEHDKENLRNDMRAICGDVAKSIKEAKNKVEKELNPAF